MALFASGLKKKVSYQEGQCLGQCFPSTKARVGSKVFQFREVLCAPQQDDVFMLDYVTQVLNAEIFASMVMRTP